MDVGKRCCSLSTMLDKKSARLEARSLAAAQVASSLSSPYGCNCATIGAFSSSQYDTGVVVVWGSSSTTPFKPLFSIETYNNLQEVYTVAKVGLYWWMQQREESKTEFATLERPRHVRLHIPDVVIVDGAIVFLADVKSSAKVLSLWSQNAQWCSLHGLRVGGVVMMKVVQCSCSGGGVALVVECSMEFG
ncbi:hypothetical protein SELMODRAFT_403872 [Selaginella moellendorffii]|uniref:Uncharacterized protein n=1 Tax=Selaginella moellendorffii TaxID=88036 RepID=D8QSU1_SELML|nr:hypothetical protein SELMODRAFT_403872 [Selaginella moellendorffii]